MSRTFTLRVMGSGNWEQRTSGPSVVWSHNFAQQAEVDNHLDLSKFAVTANPSAAGGFVINNATVFGIHDYRLNAFRVGGMPTSSGFAIEIRGVGGRLAYAIDATQMQLTLEDASQWPDPADDPAKYYFVVIHADKSNPQYMPPGATPGSKGWKEVVVVRRVTGNTVYLAGRGCSYSESATGGGIAPKAFLAGCPIGRDVAGGWGRTLMPLVAGPTGNGKDTPDQAKGGTITRRTKTPRTGINDGYYADPYYKTHSEFANWPSQASSAFDGDVFWVQFRFYIDPKRRDPDVAGGKMFFIDCHQGGGQQQIVGAGPDETEATCTIFGNYGAESYQIDNYIQPLSTDGSTATSNYPTCRVGDKVGCYEWPVGEWATCMIRVRPGYSRDADVPAPNAGLDTVNDLTVDTTYFAPTNVVEGDGVRRLRFETTLPPLFQYLPNPTNPGLDGGTFNRHSPGYFTGGGWQFKWPTTTSGSTWPTAANQFAGGVALCAGCDIQTYAGGVKRMRWTFVKKGTTTFTTGVPLNGHKMQLTVFDRTLAFPADYRRHEVDLWVKRDTDAAPTQVYGIKNWMAIFGTGENKYPDNPPGYSEFKPTGYSNVTDNLAPHPSCTFYRFGDIIMSQDQIPWPDTVGTPATAPTWFTALPERTWTKIAAGAPGTADWQKGNRISDVVPLPPYQGNQSPNDIIQAGNGAAVDQGNKSMLLVANGGHSGYQGNESYELQLNQAVPGYRRLTEPTPFADLDWHFDQGSLPPIGSRTWRDAWATATAYVASPADVVRVGNELYYCIADHTSGATFAGDAAYWALGAGDALAYEYWTRLQSLSPDGGTTPASGTRTWNLPGSGTVSILDYPATAGDGAISDPASNKSRQQWKPWTISALSDINDRPRTAHNISTPWYANGRVWFPIQNSVDEGTGPAHNVIMSFDVTAVRAGTLPRPFVPGRDVWDYWQTVTELGESNNLFGTTALDSSTGRVWYHPKNEARFYSVETATGIEGEYTMYTDPNTPSNQFTLAASAICPVAGRRLWVVLATEANTNNLCVYDLDLIEAAADPATLTTTMCQNIQNIPTIANKSWNWNHANADDKKKGWGMVWYEPDRSFLLYNCDDMNDGVGRSRNLRRIKPPLDASGNYDRARASDPAQWICDEVPCLGDLPEAVTGSAGSTTSRSVSGCSFTRFNIINDMGNGEALLLQQGNYNTPCYVMRLPRSTLPGV